MEKNLNNYDFHAIILSDKDPKSQGRYKVHIPELMPLIDDNKGIWVKNHIHSWRYTASEKYFYGEYKPLQPGTLVIVNFYENDINTGCIVRIISDQILKSTPIFGIDDKTPISSIDRDDVYIIYKTPKYHNSFIIFEETSDPNSGTDDELIKNSIHQYYNNEETSVIINTDGYHLFTKKNYGDTIEGDRNIYVKGQEKKYIEKTQEKRIKENLKQYVEDSIYTIVDKKSYKLVKEEYVNRSEISISLDAPILYLNSNIPDSETLNENLKNNTANPNKGEDEVKKQKKVKFKLTPEKEDKPDLNLKDV